MKARSITECPLCGNSNHCAPAQAGSFDVDCWCMHTPVSREALARLPDAERGKACICPACAAGADVVELKASEGLGDDKE
ncbi:MAG: cysteine-rich CWC family protein [Marinobacter sp.]|nr:cysteine-rich CWC family protein [Marinobacter sp.]